MSENHNFTIALPKGRILEVVLPILKKVGIQPEKSFFDEKDRKLKFKSNVKNINIIRVRSFDVVTFLAYGAAQMAFVGSDVLFAKKFLYRQQLVQWCVLEILQTRS